MPSLCDRFRGLPVRDREQALQQITDLDPGALADLRYDFEGFWANEHQLVTKDELERYSLVVFTGIRGSGKTHAATNLFVREIYAGRARRPRIVASLEADVEKIVVQGDSGILACCPPELRPTWIKSEGPAGVLRFRNGVEAICFSAHEPEHLTGYEGDLDLYDDVAKWGNASERAWNTARASCRKGRRTGIVATTRRGSVVLRRLLKEQVDTVLDTLLIKRPTDLMVNRWNLAAGYFEEVVKEITDPDYAAQELRDEDITEQSPFTGLAFDAAPIRILDAPRSEFAELVVAVDPAEGKGAQHDEWGIGAAVRRKDGHVVVLDDASGSYSEDEAAEAVLNLCETWDAVRIVVETNRGPRVQNAIKATYYRRLAEAQAAGTRARPMPELIPMRAADGKRLRAGPLRALYLQGRLHHMPGLGKLERQQREWDPDGPKRPKQDDRIDWVTHAVHHLADLSSVGVSPAEQTFGVADRVRAVQAKAGPSVAGLVTGDEQKLSALDPRHPRNHSRARAWGIGGGRSLL